MAKEYNDTFGDGRLYKGMQVISWFFLTTLAFNLSQLALFAIFLFVEPSLTNIVWYLLGLIPVGPALAALYAACIYTIEYRDYSEPLKLYWRLFKANFLDSLKIWLPFLLLIYLFSVNINYYTNYSTVFGQPFSWVFIIFTLVLLLYMNVLLMISTKYQFNFKSLLKLGFYYLFTRLALSTGTLFYLFIIGFLLLKVSQWLLLFMPVVMIYLVVLYNFRILNDIKENFIDNSESK